MDGDLQDPPEVILEFLGKWQEGYDVVYAVRKTRPGETRFKLWTARIFYKLIRSITHFDIPMNTGDFRLMDRKAVDAFLSLPERNRYIRGLVAWVGFRQIGVPYDRASRDSGETHYTLAKMMKLAFDGITSFSVLPLRLATITGFATSFVAFLGAGWSLYLKFLTDKTVPGWTSLMLVSLFLGGIQLLAIGIIGEYMGRIFDEVRARPLYFTQNTVGFEKDREIRKAS